MPISICWLESLTKGVKSIIVNAFYPTTFAYQFLIKPYDMNTIESFLLKKPWFKPSLKIRRRLSVSLILLGLTVSATLGAAALPQLDVSGVVTDGGGQPLEGATVAVKGTVSATQTDQTGRFLITAKEGSILIFSSIGYNSLEVPVTSSRTYNVTLEEDSESLDEVVVIGYGSQKKINLTGSVSSVSSDVLLKRPTPNVSNMLQGRVAGLQITQGTGQPGSENTSVTIRGQGSYGASSAPMVLIDGVLGSLASIAPEDVASISVLKDAASAAIYGARAANGVILVTTKRGSTGAPTISYSNNFAMHEATQLPDLIWNSAETMELWNKAVAHSGSGYATFTQAEIDAYRNGSAPHYPNYNWVDNTFKKALVHNHHLSVSGGSEHSTYQLSLGYLNQDGVLPGHGHQRYTGMISVNTELKDWISVGSNISLAQRDRHAPTFENDNYVLLIYSQTGLAQPFLPDGSGRYSARAYDKIWQNRNPVAIANEGGRDRTDYNIRAQANIDIKPFTGLTWSTKVAVNLDEAHDKLRAYDVDAYYYQDKNSDGDFGYAGNSWPVLDNGLNQDNYRTNLYTLFSTVQYDKTAGNHDFSVLGGYSQENQKYSHLGGSRIGIPSPVLSELNAGTPQGQSTRGTGYEWAIQSFFGRLNYNFSGKYLLEANLRYDGTSRIHRDSRWGLFPSVSAGWRLSQERFMQSADWIDELKIRLSYGKLGNQEISNYPYQDILSQANYAFGSGLSPGVYVTRLTDKSLVWETTEVFNVGLDYSMLNDLLGLSLDVYRKNTTDILYTQPIPASVGLSAPTVNFGAMMNTGIDLELRHRNQIGEVNYRVVGIFNTYRNEVTRLLAPSIGGNTISRVGDPWGSFYMLEWIGVFQSEADVENSPTQPFSPKPGDLKFKDQDGNGSVGQEDRVIIDGAHPKFAYSLGIDVGYKQFDLSAFLQGVQGRQLYVNQFGMEPFYQAGAPPVKWRNAWTPENPTNELPHIYVGGNSEYSPVNGNASTFFLQDASYLRLKNVQIGYNFSPEMVNRIGLGGLRVFVSGDNLLTFTKYEGADPERAGNGRFAQYPQVRIFSAGLNVKL